MVTNFFLKQKYYVTNKKVQHALRGLVFFFWVWGEGDKLWHKFEQCTSCLTPKMLNLNLLFMFSFILLLYITFTNLYKFVALNFHNVINNYFWLHIKHFPFIFIFNFSQLKINFSLFDVHICVCLFFFLFQFIFQYLFLFHQVVLNLVAIGFYQNLGAIKIAYGP